MALIEVESVRYTYTGRGVRPIEALRGVSLTIEAGEYVALVGANGSGKTTLALHLNALLLPSAGSVRIDGLDSSRPESASEIRRRVGMVFQSPADQIVATVAEDDVAFGPENLGVPPAELVPLVRECLERVGLWEQRLRPPHMLSAGEQQRLAIAGALAMRPRCLVLDEPTSMLDPAGARGVLQLLDELHRSGVTVILVTHSMEEAARAERILVMHEGRLVEDGPAATVLAAADLERWALEPPFAVRLSRELRGRLPDSSMLPVTADPDELARSLAGLAEASRQDALGNEALAGGDGTLGARDERDAHETGDGRAVVEVSDLRHVYLRGTPLEHVALDGVDLTAEAGRITALVGATGSGKSTVLQHLNGLLLPQGGSVRVLGQDLGDPRVDLVALRRMAALAMQRPERQVFERYVGDDVAFGPRMAGVVGPELRDRVRWAMEVVGLDFERFRDRPTFALSGGERRLVGLAGVLALRPKLLLLDEPTSGLDPAGRSRVRALIRRLCDEGTDVVLATHAMEEASELADRIVVLARGRSVAAGRWSAVCARPESVSAWGLDVPQALGFVRQLRRHGLAIEEEAGSSTFEVLLEELVRRCPVRRSAP